ncbi:hypothetical protein QR680_004141 [Steinernema hermaphroditum]|uniref:N-acetylgalactosaminide beta-1,3-galactosyltransferase n=1 Tax=Steinernema hermaphroditum TaxID=289476 RepID=A0AA39HQ03_9BILA|nr:hypothetical protein QR680_004141 [Steinernema hermaphroditum]
MWLKLRGVFPIRVIENAAGAYLASDHFLSSNAAPTMRLSRVRRNLESPLFKWLFAFVWPKNSFVLFLGVLLHVLISSTYLPVFPTKTTQIPLDNSSIFTVIIAKRSRSSQLHAIHSTWLQRMDRFHVFSDGTIRDPNVPQTRMPRVYKTWRSWLRTRWIAHFTKEHITDAYDWYLFVHDETFLMTEELKLLLKEHSPSEKIYFVIGENVSSRQKYAKAALVLNRASLDFLAATMHHHKHSICGNTPNIFDLHACFATEGFKKVDVDEDLQGKNRYLHVKRHLSPTEYTEHTKLGIYDDGKSIFDHLSRDVLAFFNLRRSELLVYELLLYGLERSHLVAKAHSDED